MKTEFTSFTNGAFNNQATTWCIDNTLRKVNPTRFPYEMYDSLRIDDMIQSVVGKPRPLDHVAWAHFQKNQPHKGLA